MATPEDKMKDAEEKRQKEWSEFFSKVDPEQNRQDFRRAHSGHAEQERGPKAIKSGVLE